MEKKANEKAAVDYFEIDPSSDNPFPKILANNYSF